jgi:SseB protein N-terminal domain
MIDENTPDFQPVNMVEKQLVAAAIGNSDQQKAFEKFILDETLYFATPEVHPEGNITLQVDTSIQLLNATLDDGRQAAAVFTSPQRVGETFGEVGYMGLQGRTLFEMIRAKPAVLNPGQTYCVVWEPSAMASDAWFADGAHVSEGHKNHAGIASGPADRSNRTAQIRVYFYS